MANPYLYFYNAASAFGWAYILFQIIQSGLNGDNGAELWKRIGVTTTIVQSCATLEIFHSLFGLVRSPLLPTFFQVLSRVSIVWMYMIPSSASSGHWSLYLCVTSWALVEIPRYLFYTMALSHKGEPHKINSILFWLRYNLFIVLYPTGITGELLQAYNAYGLNSSTFFMRCVAFHLLLYVPLSPFMVLNMWKNKNNAYKKIKRSANPRPLNGLIWPLTSDDGNTRSTTKTNKSIWVASVRAIDKNIADKCDREKNWRFKYGKHIMDNVELSCKSTENALKIAQDGLDKAHSLFEFKRGDKIMSFKKAMTSGVISDSYSTHIIKGNGSPISKELNIPYGGGEYQGKPYYLGKHNKTSLSGIKLREQLNKWVKYGTIEQSAADSINMVSNNRNEWLDLSNHYFILLGATSAMGPLYFLLSHGANIIAVDLNRDFIWKKLFDAVNNSSGSLIFPIKNGTDNADKLSLDALSKISGCDLLGSTPEIANWLESLVTNNKIIPSDKPLSIGNYTYLDGALHVQLSLACDSIINRVCSKRSNIMIAFLCTPTDNHVITEDAYNASKEALKSSVPTWASVINTLSGGKLLGKSNYKSIKSVTQKTGSPIRIIDGIAVAQGPNYALAKRLQHWRAIISFNNGHKISSNVAPSTATMSVVHNAQFAAAYGGMHNFKPMEVMYQRTSLSVMGTLLIHDLWNKDAASNPASKIAKNFRNPYESFSFGSFHGGVWRCSYKIDKIGVPSALAFYFAKYNLYIAIATINLAAGMSWLCTGHLIPFRN